MKPSEVAEILADRVKRDTSLAVHTSPDLLFQRNEDQCCL